MNEAEIDEVEDVVVGSIDQHKVGALRQMQRGWMHLLAEQVLPHQALGHPRQTLKFLMEDVGEAVGVRIVAKLINNLLLQQLIKSRSFSILRLLD